MSAFVEPSSRREILIARHAFAVGFGYTGREGFADGWQAAARVYPLPKITLPRELPDPRVEGVSWFIGDDGSFQHCSRDGIARAFNAWPTPERVALWADLLARPTETVEAEP